MLKYSWQALCALLAFGVIVSLLPENGGARSQPQVTLSGVKMRLYPSQDQDAEWRFEANTITYDPQKGETEILKPSVGERYVREKGKPGQKLDMTMKTDHLTIDSGDNLRTREAELYSPSDCTTVALTGDEKHPVRIDQAVGYTAPKVSVSSPLILMEGKNMTLSFQLDAQSDLEKNEFHSNPDVECKDGRVVKKAAGGPS